MGKTEKNMQKLKKERLLSKVAAQCSIRYILPANMRIPIALALLCNMVAYYGTRAVTGNFHHYDLTTKLDSRIPFIPCFILIYWGCYLFWAANYVIGVRQEDSRKAYRFISADFLAKLICMAVFLVFPTTNTRPEVYGNGIFEQWMRTLYAVDAADNLFPSIHCLTSWFCFLAVKDNEAVGKIYKSVSLLLAMLICLSTLKTKQHVLVDVAGGIFLAQGSYWLVEKTGFCNLYRRWVEGIGQQVCKKK